MDIYGKIQNGKFCFELDHTLHASCSTVINYSYNRTSATLIGHDNLVGHKKSNTSSINIGCSIFNVSNSLLDIQPDKTVSDTDMTVSEKKHTWLKLCGFRNADKNNCYLISTIHCILCLNQYLKLH